MSTIDPTTPTGQMPNGKTGGYTLVMSDEFNSTTLDTKWKNEHDFAAHTATTAWDINAGGNSCLRMWWNGAATTSTSGGLGNQIFSTTGANPFRQRFGFYEARVKMIQGKGFFGGWWLYPYSNTQTENSDGTQQELDITEWFSYENGDHLVDTTNYQSKNCKFTIWQEGGGGSQISAPTSFEGFLGGHPSSLHGYDNTLSTQFHTYGMEWTATGGLSFYFDGVKQGTTPDPWGAGNNIQLAIFMQLWWGGNGGNPQPAAGPTTVGSGQSMQWDYVRVWSIGGSAPAPTPAPAPTLTIAQVISDMQAAAGEAVVIGAANDWQRFPSISTPAPRGDAIPSWWTYSRPTWLYDELGWYAACEAQGNTSTNTRVQVVNIRSYILSQATRTWNRVDLNVAPWTDVFAVNGSVYQGFSDMRTEPSGGVSTRPAYPNFEHGYGNTVHMSNPSDERAVFVALEFRLILDNPAGTDDRANAKYVVSAAGDWWPGTQNPPVNDWPWAPAIANGRFLLATNNWRTATMLTPNPNYGCTFAEIQNNPPPLSLNAPAPTPAPVPMTAALTSATFADGQTINGLAQFRVDGDSIANCELIALSAGTYTPMYGRFTLGPGLGGSASRACTFNWDTTTISNGPLVCHISAFDAPPGGVGTEIMVAQFHYIINNVAPSPISISATASAGPLNLDMQFVVTELDMLSRYIRTGKKR